MSIILKRPTGFKETFKAIRYFSILLLFTLCIQSSLAWTQISQQRKPDVSTTSEGKAFYRACYEVLKDTRPRLASSTCRCIVRNLESNLEKKLQKSDILKLSKVYCQNNCKEADNMQSLDEELLYKFEKNIATQCLKNPRVNVSEMGD